MANNTAVKLVDLYVICMTSMGNWLPWPTLVWPMFCAGFLDCSVSKWYQNDCRNFSNTYTCRFQRLYSSGRPVTNLARQTHGSPVEIHVLLTFAFCVCARYLLSTDSFTGVSQSTWEFTGCLHPVTRFDLRHNVASLTVKRPPISCVATRSAADVLAI